MFKYCQTGLTPSAARHTGVSLDTWLRLTAAQLHTLPHGFAAGEAVQGTILKASKASFLCFVNASTHRKNWSFKRKTVSFHLMWYSAHSPGESNNLLSVKNHCHDNHPLQRTSECRLRYSWFIVKNFKNILECLFLGGWREWK